MAEAYDPEWCSLSIKVSPSVRYTYRFSCKFETVMGSRLGLPTELELKIIAFNDQIFQTAQQLPPMMLGVTKSKSASSAHVLAQTHFVWTGRADHSRYGSPHLSSFRF